MLDGARTAAICVAAVALAVVAFAPDPDAPSVTTLDRMERAFVPRTEAAAPTPELRSLPDAWSAHEREHHAAAVYSATFSLDRVPDEPWVVYVPRADMDAAVRVNGALLGGPTDLRTAPRRMRHYPLRFDVPAGLLRAGDNDVEVGLLVEPTSSGALSAVHIGPQAVLGPAHAWTRLVQIDLVRIFALLAIALVTDVLVLFRRRDPTTSYRWLVVALSCWTVYSLEVWVRAPPVSARGVEVVANTANFLGVWAIALAFHRSFEVHRRAFEIASLAAIAVAVAVLWSVPAHLVWPTRAVLGVGLAALAGSVVAFVARAAGTSGWVLPRAHVLAGVVGLAFGTHDLVSAPVGVPLLGVWLTPYAGGFAIVLSLGASYQHVTRSLARARMRHSDLARLVAEKEAELEQRDAHVRRIERESVLVRERRRLTRELQHDVGADLVAAVAAAESGQPLARAGARIRDALDALRLVVDSLVPAESVIDVLARLRSRMAPSLERRGARIVWRVADLPEVGGFAAEHALCLLRFVHAAFRAVEAREGATTVTVRTGADRGPAGECAFIEVEDDAPAARASAQLARCEATLRAQARRLGGELVTASGDGGTRVRLRVPLSLAPVAPE